VCRRVGRLLTSSTSPVQPKRPGRIAHACVLRDLVEWHGWWVSPKGSLSAVRSCVTVSVTSGGQNRYCEFGRWLGGLEVWNSFRECWRFVHVHGAYHLPMDAALTYHPVHGCPRVLSRQTRVNSLTLAPKYGLCGKTSTRLRGTGFERVSSRVPPVKPRIPT